MASKYVKRARQLGLLGYPTRRGVAGAEAEQSPVAPPKTRRTSKTPRTSEPTPRSQP
jgi:hypothetical protein